MSDAFELLELQISQLDNLTVLLTEELEAFKNRQADHILILAEKKSSLLEAITKTDQDIASLSDIKEIQHNADFKTAVAKCDKHLATLKQQNATNAQVIQTSLNNISQLKHTLLAAKNTNQMTYTKAGKATTQMLGKGIKA